MILKVFQDSLTREFSLSNIGQGPEISERRKNKMKMCQKWDSNPRLHSETRSPKGGKRKLESGALDHSAILTR